MTTRTILLAATALAAAVAASPARAQSTCFMYYPEGANGGVVLCPPRPLTADQHDYLVARMNAQMTRRERVQNECQKSTYDPACIDRVERETPLPEPSPDVAQFLASLGVHG